MKIKIGVLSMVLAVLWCFAVPAQAQGPTAYVRSILDRAMAVQTNPGLAGAAHEKERAREVHQIIASSFDFPMMARESLGATYGRLSPGQQAEFTQVFSFLFQNSYTRLVLNFLKKENVVYTKETFEDFRAQVNTKMERPNETIPVDYKMHRQGQGWVLYDVIVDGVSILHDYETQFARVIQTRGYAVLLEKMKKQYEAIR
jgi:phospholipid transport system substrate-binding protein